LIYIPLFHGLKLTSAYQVLWCLDLDC
jgi:hypothetical protein